MDILLQNGANHDDIVLTRRNIQAQEFAMEALWECASKGQRKLLWYLLNCGTDVSAVLEMFLFIVLLMCLVEFIRFDVERRADINIHNAKNNTALLLAALTK